MLIQNQKRYVSSSIKEFMSKCSLECPRLFLEFSGKDIADLNIFNIIYKVYFETMKITKAFHII